MLDFFKNIIAGVTVLIQSISFAVGIKSDSPKINLSPSPVVIASPILSSSPNPTPTESPKINNQVDNSNSQVKEVQGVATHDGRRTGNIIKYKEWCKGNQEISIYENELITKKSSDGGTYSMTQGDWECYEKNLRDSTAKIPSTSSTPNITSNTISSIDPGKTAELRNIFDDFKRQTTIAGNAQVLIQFYQGNLSACLNHVSETINNAPIVAGSKLTFSPSQIQTMRDNCNSYQADINNQSNIYNAALKKAQEGTDRIKILAAECPPCWEVAKKDL